MVIYALIRLAAGMSPVSGWDLNISRFFLVNAALVVTTVAVMNIC